MTSLDRKVPPSLITTCLATVAFVVSSTTLASGQSQNAQQSPGFHIWMTVQQTSGAPVGYLKDKDFKVSQGGIAYHLTLEQPVPAHTAKSSSPVPTALLVFFDPKFSVYPGAVQSSVDALHAVWEQGWRVSFVRPDGSQTPYLKSEAEASQMLAASVPPVALRRSTAVDAVETLEATPGRRVLLYLSTTNGWLNTKVPVAMSKEANRVMAQVYVVDGGSPAHSDRYGGQVAYEHLSSAPASPPTVIVGGGGFTSYPQQDLFKFGRFHDASLSDAVHNLLKGSAGYYDLKIDCTLGNCPNIRQPLSVHINEEAPLRVVAMGAEDAQGLTVNVFTK